MIRRQLIGCGMLTVCACVTLTGCRSPSSYSAEADKAALTAITNKQQEVFGRTETFSIDRPSDTLRRRLMIKQQLPALTNRVFSAVAAEPMVLSLDECLRIGARNSKSYQSNKESVFQSALALDLQRHAFENTYSGALGAMFSGDESDDPANRETSADGAVGFSRTLKSGATIAGKLSLDVVKLLTGDRSSSLGILADATITIPLLKDAGREIVTEPLTQAERDVAYALMGFERFKKEFALGIARQYLSVLQAMDRVHIARNNLRRLEENLSRSEELGKAGRLPETEVNQTRQDVLRAQNRLNGALQDVDDQLDSFKQTLGLPVDAKIALIPAVLERIADTTMKLTTEEGAAPLTEAEAIKRAFENRWDLRVIEGNLEDARREVRVTENALEAGVEIKLSASGQDRRYRNSVSDDVTFGDGSYSAAVDLDLPWERTSERNAYRNALIGLARSERAVEVKEDEVKSEVRSTLRTLNERYESFRIQSKAVELAQRRVESTALFEQAGRTQTRDVLEAEEALVSAQNELTDALVSFCVARWELMLNTGELTVGADGLWNADVSTKEVEGE